MHHLNESLRDTRVHAIYFIQFHEPWGQLMKTSYQNSRFAHQWLANVRHTSK
ncbi:hypothetical protein glysoja_009288 [Glycine soja]|nr:hypothetical protein glysoja_009288 [Glycine soja]